MIFETQTHPVIESIMIGRQNRFLQLPRRKMPPLRRSRLPAHQQRFALLPQEDFGFHSAAACVYELVDRKVATSWIWSNSSAVQRLVTLQAGIIHKEVKRHGEFPSAPGRAAAKQSLTPTTSHSSTLHAPRCRQGLLGPVSHFCFWHGRTNARLPRNTAETDRPLS